MSFEIFASYPWAGNVKIPGENLTFIEWFCKNLANSIEFHRFGTPPAIFVDSQEIPPGASLPTKITQALEEAEVMLCFLCDAYFQSAWCPQELNYFSQRFSNLRLGAHSRIYKVYLLPTALEEAFEALRDSSLYAKLHEGKERFSPLKKSEQEKIFEVVDILARRLIDLLDEAMKLRTSQDESGDSTPASEETRTAVYLPYSSTAQLNREKVFNHLEKGFVVYDHLNGLPQNCRYSVHILDASQDLAKDTRAVLEARNMGLTPLIYVQGKGHHDLDSLGTVWRDRDTLIEFIKGIKDTMVQPAALPVQDQDKGILPRVRIHHADPGEPLSRAERWLRSKNLEPVHLDTNRCSGDLVVISEAYPFFDIPGILVRSPVVGLYLPNHNNPLLREEVHSMAIREPRPVVLKERAKTDEEPLCLMNFVNRVLAV